MKFELTVLGCGSAIPRPDRRPSAQLLNVQEEYFLIDCGEGTQLQLKRCGIKFQRIARIFISHLHGDHYLGLMGLLGTFHLLGRQKELHIHGPPALGGLLNEQMERTGTTLRFPLHFHATNGEEEELLFEHAALGVKSFPLHHNTHCTGFHFQEKPKLRKIKKEKLEEYDIPIRSRPLLKEGKDVKDRQGQVVPCEEITDPPPPSFAYAYCCDTAYSSSLPDKIKGVSLLYHDSTFLNDLKERAERTHHSTAAQAASVAKEAEASRLLLGHFSARYRKTAPFLEEANEHFRNSIAAQDGMRIRVDRPDLEPELLLEGPDNLGSF